MVEVIIGRAGVGKTFTCLERAKKILQTEPIEIEIFFLLPAYQTNRTELALLEMTGGSFNVHMNSFKRFARQLLEEIGVNVLPRISEIGRRLLLKKILLRRTKAHELKYFARAAKQRGFAKRLSDTLKELRNYSIDAEKLDEMADKVSVGSLRDKLHDLKILAQDLRDGLAGKHTIDEDLMDLATEVMDQSATLAFTEIFIDNFIFFDPQQRNFLRKLFACARNVHITLTIDTNLNSSDNVEDFGVFHRAFETFKTVRDLAQDAGVEFKITRLDTQHRIKVPAPAILEQRLFDYDAKKFDDATGLKIVAAENKYAEIEHVAQEILRMAEEGWQLRDIGVIARDEKYFLPMVKIFELHEIPFFLDKKSPATHHALVRLIRSAFKVLRGWRRLPILNCLRTGFFDVTQEEVDLLENYMIEFDLKGASTWQRSWDYRRTKSFDPPKNFTPEEERAFIERINAVRQKVSAPLIRFAERMKNSERNAIAQVTVLLKLFEDLNVRETLAAWSREEKLSGNTDMAKENYKVWNDVIKLFYQVIEAPGDGELSAWEFEQIIGEGLDELELSLIPTGMDEVKIAQFDQNSLQNLRAIFVLGFTDENFPRRTMGKILLDDTDRMRLNDAGFEISLGGREQLFAESFLIYRGLTEARELLVISYPIADLDGKKIFESSLLNRLCEIFPLTIEHVNIDVLRNLISETFVADEKILSPETARKLYAPKQRLRAAVTKFEFFNECPFRFFAKYGLNLQERVEYKVQSPDIGIILHSIMSEFGRNLQEENRAWSSVGNAELVARVDKIIDELTPSIHNKILLSTKTLRYRRERIKKVAVESLNRLIELDKVSDFHPQMFEEKFIADKKISDVDIDLIGRIDRIDLSSDGKYFLIIDYKTGKAALNLEKIFDGLNLQLAIYLGAAQKFSGVEGREAGAMLYCLLKIVNKIGRTEAEASRAAAKELKMPGLICVDDGIADAIDCTKNFVEPGKNNGVTRADFQTIIDYAEKFLLATGERILNGCIDVKPAKFSDNDACEHCPYFSLCNFDRDINETVTPTKRKPEEIIAAMREELQR